MPALKIKRCPLSRSSDARSQAQAMPALKIKRCPLSTNATTKRRQRPSCAAPRRPRRAARGRRREGRRSREGARRRGARSWGLFHAAPRHIRTHACARARSVAFVRSFVRSFGARAPHRPRTAHIWRHMASHGVIWRHMAHTTPESTPSAAATTTTTFGAARSRAARACALSRPRRANVGRPTTPSFEELGGSNKAFR